MPIECQANICQDLECHPFAICCTMSPPIRVRANSSHQASLCHWIFSVIEKCMSMHVNFDCCCKAKYLSISFMISFESCHMSSLWLWWYVLFLSKPMKDNIQSSTLSRPYSVLHGLTWHSNGTKYIISHITLLSCLNTIKPPQLLICQVIALFSSKHSLMLTAATSTVGDSSSIPSLLNSISKLIKAPWWHVTYHMYSHGYHLWWLISRENGVYP